MKEVLGVIAAIAIGVFAYLYVSEQPPAPSGPTQYRANQPAGASTSGVSQQMPRDQAADRGDASETGVRAREILSTASGDV